MSYNHGIAGDLTFTIKTEHGNYRHQGSVDIPASMTSIQAFEAIQSASPYTRATVFDPTNEAHIQIVGYIACVRQDPKHNPYRPSERWALTNTPEDDTEWFPGWSWTWIKVRQ